MGVKWIVIGSIRRECPDPVIIGAKHIRVELCHRTQYDTSIPGQACTDLAANSPRWSITSNSVSSELQHHYN
jgi:hypothetical protein